MPSAAGFAHSESRTEEKDVMVKVNLINKNN